MRRFGNGFAGGENTRGGLCLHEADDIRAFAFDEPAYFRVVKAFAPGLVQADNIGPMTPAHFGNAIAEKSVSEHCQLLTRLNEICYCCFHAGAAGTGNRKGEVVFRAENLAKSCANIFHDAEEK